MAPIAKSRRETMAKLTPIPFDRLLRRIFYEYKKTGSIFDLSSRNFYRPKTEYDLAVKFLGKNAANPAGPAAGPHTQLAQNIVLSWLAGSRILELKTVQINDQLELTRPCIDMATVGYNTEWSQELLLDESLREYVKASMTIEILKHWMFLADGGKSYEPNQFDTILDLSVGYDLAGIRSGKIRAWLQSMRDASSLIDEYRKQIPTEFAAYKELSFNPEIGDSLTLSTFHGTRADEIESICEFLIAEMDFNVVIKMNPPMLGKEKLEYLLHDKLGYTHIEVNHDAYAASITYDDAVELVRRLQVGAAKKGRAVGVKFGNTLEVINKGKFLQGEVLYLSGQPLHVLHLQLVHDWRQTFGPNFPISFSAGVDANNFADCVSSGLVPVTTCTDLLRPRGYARLPHYLQNLELRMKAAGARTIDEFIVNSDESASEDFEKAVMSNTADLLKKSINSPRYHYAQNQKAPRKVDTHLLFWDCLNCDKCFPVCPNDANFCIPVEPVDLKYFIVEVDQDGWHKTEGGDFRIKEVNQIANFADACNDCGNCGVFCPEEGGPYLEKPRFFGSLNAFKDAKNLSGFYLDIKPDKPTLIGRFKDREFELSWERVRDRYLFRSGTAVIETNPSTHEISNASLINAKKAVVDMQYYHAMSVLLKGILDTSRVNFVNVEAQGQVWI